MQLNFTRFVRVLFSSLFIQTSWSFLSMQSMGFLFALRSGLDKAKRKEILDNQKKLFNTHPYMASYLIGATLRIYDEKITETDDISKFITIAQTSFASAGDSMFWQTIRPALLLLSLIVSLHVGIIGPIIFLIIYNTFHLYHRSRGLIDGYQMGTDVIFILKSKRFTLVQKIFEIVGAFLSTMLISLLAIQYSYLLIIPFIIFFLALLYKRISSIIITIAIIVILVIIVLIV